MGALALAVVMVGGTLWLRPWERNFEAASEQRMAFPLPDKPSVAVLPFDNLSGDPEKEHFADGLTENIISTLSRVPTMFVIARNSTFTYKGRPVKVQEVAENLGVRYVLGGSVRIADDRVRVTAQLIDAIAGTHIWSEQYDRDYGDLFALHDDITREIVTALQVELTDGEQARVWSALTDSPEAGNHMMKGVEKFYRFNKEDNLLARAEMERAVDADPYFALGYTLLAWTHWADASYGRTDLPERSLTRAVLFAGKAMALNPDIPDVYALRGAIHLYRREFADAIAAGEKALELNPNHATNAALLALTLVNTGRAADALAMIRTAMRLSPYYPAWFVGILADAYYGLGEYEQSAAVLLGLMERPDDTNAICRCRVGIALAYAALGREDEARDQITLLRAEDPQFTISQLQTSNLHRDTSAVERRAAVLKRLGLPE
ncbi:MAG: tetratricopeptide repeat protein [Rhodospirillales bacterium]|nr:tetratricopeptide repeat protein [Rhodospirillales bacterium]MDP6804052.1 tetratricopeptide repeat protein [Rhodospirillales bacterium]